MKKYIPLLFTLSSVICQLSSAQNTGIGTTAPARAKLEVHGAVDATSAIFGGESAGISLQRNWPGIGFNEYYNGGSKYIGTGFAAKQFLDPGSGYMYFDVYPNGSANTNVLSYARAMVISNTGNIGIRTNPANASLYAIKADNVDGSAIFGELLMAPIFITVFLSILISGEGYPAAKFLSMILPGAK